MKRLTILFLSLFGFSPLFAATSSRSFNPPSYQTGQTGQSVSVTLTVTPTASDFIYGVEELLPLNWTPASISHGGIVYTYPTTHLTLANRKVIKWGPFVGNAVLGPTSTTAQTSVARSLTYTLAVPTTETGRKTFDGQASIDGTSQPLLANLDPANPSDLGGTGAVAKDLRINGTEFATYGACYKIGCTWAVAPNPISNLHFIRAALIYKSGEFYHFNPALSCANASCWEVGQ